MISSSVRDPKNEEKAILKILENSSRQSLVLSIVALLIALFTGVGSLYYMRQDQASDETWQKNQIDAFKLQTDELKDQIKVLNETLSTNKKNIGGNREYAPQ